MIMDITTPKKNNNTNQSSSEEDEEEGEESPSHDQPDASTATAIALADDERPIILDNDDNTIRAAAGEGEGAGTGTGAGGGSPQELPEAAALETNFAAAAGITSTDHGDVQQLKEGDHNDRHHHHTTNSCFAHHEKLQLPPAPNGMEWAYQSSTHRWRLEPLVQAEITVLDEGEDDQLNNHFHNTTRRTTSSTPTPTDEIIAPPVLDHWIQSTDTFAGLCLKYGVTATQIRRANFGFSGTNLSLAPNPLKVPNIARAVPEDTKNNNQELIVQSFLLCFREELTKSEAKCYLSLNDWDVQRAMQNAERDLQERDFSTDPSGERARFDTPFETVFIDEDL